MDARNDVAIAATAALMEVLAERFRLSKQFAREAPAIIYAAVEGALAAYCKEAPVPSDN